MGADLMARRSPASMALAIATIWAGLALTATVGIAMGVAIGTAIARVIIAFWGM